MSENNAEWEKVNLKLLPLDALKPPLVVALVALQFVESLLEIALLVIKAVGLFLINPLVALIALILAAVRLIINQLRATGFSFLLIIPDFQRGDVAGILNSVSGGFSGFERKIVYKMRDKSDLYRPAYPEGSVVACVIGFFSVSNAYQLYLIIKKILDMFFGAAPFTSLVPSPVNLKVNLTADSNDPYSAILDVRDSALRLANTIKKISKDQLRPSLMLSWSMSSNPGGSNAPGFMNSLVSAYLAFRLPGFIIERSELPKGKEVKIQIETDINGTLIEDIQKEYGIPTNPTFKLLREPDGSTSYRLFEKRTFFDTGDVGSNILDTFSNTYRYLDKNVDYGKTYYYRVRAVFGDPSDYCEASEDAIREENSEFVEVKNNIPRINYSGNGDDVIVGSYSRVVSSTVPQNIDGWDPYTDIFNATMAGFLLNFEIPAIPASDDAFKRRQTTGWGTLDYVGSQLAIYKLLKNDSNKFKNFLPVIMVVRKLLNLVINSILSNANLSADLQTQYELVRDDVERLLGNPKSIQGFDPIGITWTFPKYKKNPFSNTITPSSLATIDSYLSKELSYKKGQRNLNGPYPVGPWSTKTNDITYTSFDDNKRAILGELLSSVYSCLTVTTGYLRWYGVTLGELFGPLMRFLMALNQFINSILKALRGALQEAEKIIRNIMDKIRRLEELVKAIIALINLLNLDFTLGILAYGTTGGGVESLITRITTAENKPITSPSDLHSGFVLTAGTVGKGAIDAINAILTIIGVGAIDTGEGEPTDSPSDLQGANQVIIPQIPGVTIPKPSGNQGS